MTTKPSPTPRSRPSPTPRTGRVEHAGSTPDEQSGEPVRAAGAGAEPGRGATMPACLVAAAVLLGAAATWFALEASSLRAGNHEANAALVDVEETAEVTEDVSAALESIFSYNYASPDRTRRAAERVLLDGALRQYEARFAAASGTAGQRQPVRTTNVRAIGVRTLGEGTARLLVFLDQQTLTSNGTLNKQTTVSLDVVAKKVGGAWKIAELEGNDGE